MLYAALLRLLSLPGHRQGIGNGVGEVSLPLGVKYVTRTTLLDMAFSIQIRPGHNAKPGDIIAVFDQPGNEDEYEEDDEEEEGGEAKNPIEQQYINTTINTKWKKNEVEFVPEVGRDPILVVAVFGDMILGLKYEHVTDVLAVSFEGAVWKTKNGRVLNAHEMTDSHLRNSIRMLERNVIKELEQVLVVNISGQKITLHDPIMSPLNYEIEKDQEIIVEGFWVERMPEALDAVRTDYLVEKVNRRYPFYKFLLIEASRRNIKLSKPEKVEEGRILQL